MGEKALSACKMCEGVTEGVGASKQSVVVELARSIAPRRTSNIARTSPVSAAIFLLKRVRVGSGRNFSTDSVCSELDRGESLERRIPSNC